MYRGIELDGYRCPFQIGDIVTIREWDDMAAEFPVLRGADGHCILIDGNCNNSVFTRRMSHYCGKSFEVKRVICELDKIRFRIRFDGDDDFIFTPSMMRLATEVIDESVDVPDDEYISLLGL